MSKNESMISTLRAGRKRNDFEKSQAETRDATARPDHVMLTWSDDPATTQTVSFRTAPGVAVGSVLYRKADQAIADGYNILILSDRGLDRENAAMPRKKIGSCPGVARQRDRRDFEAAE